MESSSSSSSSTPLKKPQFNRKRRGFGQYSEAVKELIAKNLSIDNQITPLTTREAIATAPRCKQHPGADVIPETNACSECGLVVGTAVVLDDHLPRRHEDESLLEDTRVHHQIDIVRPVIRYRGPIHLPTIKKRKVESPEIIKKEEKDDDFDGFTSSPAPVWVPPPPTVTTKEEQKEEKIEVDDNDIDNLDWETVMLTALYPSDINNNTIQTEVEPPAAVLVNATTPKRKRRIKRTPVINNSTLDRYKLSVSDILHNTGLDGHDRISKRAYELGEMYISRKTAEWKRIKKDTVIATVCCMRACMEHGIGLRRSHLEKAIGPKYAASIGSRFAHWHREVIYDTLHLKPMKRHEILQACINHCFRVISMDTKMESPLVEALVSYTLFMLSLGDVLPEVEANGSPYTTTVAPLVAAAHKHVELPEGKEEKKETKTKKKTSTRTFAWVRAISARYHQRVRLPVSSTSMTLEERTQEIAKWKQQIKCKHALDLLATNPKPVTRAADSKWPLNRADLSTVAAAIIHAVSQLRPQRPRGTAKAKASGVVYFRLSQDEIANATYCSKAPMRALSQELRDLMYVFL